MSRTAFRSLVACTALTLSPVVPAGAEPAPVDWSAVPVEKVTLFYPGQSSFQWLRSREHPGARMVQRGAACVRCHSGKEQQIGNSIVSGGRLEPDPIEGKKGSLRLAVQATHDDDNLYLRFRWETQADRPGVMHNYMRYTGESWEFFGGPRSAERVRQGEEPPPLRRPAGAHDR